MGKEERAWDEVERVVDNRSEEGHDREHQEEAEWRVIEETRERVSYVWLGKKKKVWRRSKEIR
jgi:hypothetical protein